MEPRLLKPRLIRPGYSWVILASGFLVLFFGTGSRFAFGLVLKPMSEDLGWSRSTLTLGLTAFMLVSAVSLPVVGRLIDRYSLRLVMGVGAVLAALGIIFMGRIYEPWHLFLAYGLVYGIGIAAISNLPVGVLISRWFYRRRGAAVSAAISGGAVGQLVIIGVLSAFLASMGWRTAFTALGFVALAVMVPVVLTAVRSRPPPPIVEPRLGETYAAGDKAASAPAKPLLDEGLPLKTILRSRQFALLLTMYAICGFQDFFVATHLVAFAQDQGVGSVLAGNLLAWMGLMGLVGVLLSGVLSDALGAARPTLICFLLRIVIFGFIIYFQDTVAVAAFALVYGFTFLVTAPLTVVFAGAIFGQGRLGLVAGSISMVHQIFGGLGALTGALVFDAWGSYDRAFLLLLAISVVAVPVMLMLRERPLHMRSIVFETGCK